MVGSVQSAIIAKVNSMNYLAGFKAFYKAAIYLFKIAMVVQTLNTGYPYGLLPNLAWHSMFARNMFIKPKTT